MRRETLISTLLDDVRAFLKQQLGHSLALATASSLQLAIFDGDTCTPLSPDMTAESADLFNAAAQSYHKDGCTLVVITPRTVPMPRPPQPPPQPYPPDEPHPPAGLDQLQQRRLLDRDGAGNTRPHGGQHNSLLNSLCNAPVDHPPGANLVTDSRSWRKLGAHIAAIEQQPMRCCFNCAMVNYPESGDKIKVRATSHSDLRAWRVFEPVIRETQRALHVPLEDIFLCEEAGVDAQGFPLRQVYTCTYCKKAKCQDPVQYDTFDGHSVDGMGNWTYENNGVGEAVPEPLAALTSEERLVLSIVKMADAAFEPSYSSCGYMHFSSGAFLRPGDYHGLSTLLVRTPSPNDGLPVTMNVTVPQNVATGGVFYVDTPSELQMAVTASGPAGTVMNVQLPRDPASSQRLQRALAHLLDEEHGNPIVRQTLSCFERELARVPDDVFPNDAGTGALPVMAWDDQQLRDPGDRIGQEAPRALAPDQRITGALQTVVEPPTDARLQQNAANQQTLGERYARDGTRLLQPLIADSPNASVGAALHPTIYHTGEGDWHKTPTACDEAHFRKFRLASINPKFRAAQEVPPAP